MEHTQEKKDFLLTLLEMESEKPKLSHLTIGVDYILNEQYYSPYVVGAPFEIMGHGSFDVTFF